MWHHEQIKKPTMDDEEFRIAVLTDPFEPKRIHLSDGRTVDIPRPGEHCSRETNLRSFD